MNVVILTGRFGEGHYSAAVAVEEELRRKMPEDNIEVIDVVQYVFPRSCKLIYKVFNYLVNKCSRVYNLFCKITERDSHIPLRHIIAYKVEKLLYSYEADMVIVTVPIFAKYVAEYKKKTKSTIPLYTYITDITVRDEWIADTMEMYFVGGEDAKKALLAKGISEKCIRISGIPVKQAFHETKDYYYLSWERELLIMGGGLGLIPRWRELLCKVSQMKQVHITIITGHNERLLKTIQQEFPQYKYPQIDAIGYTDKVDQYMKQADLILTKPGGITTFEAIYCQTPLFILRPFLTQEIGNANYIANNNIGYVVWSNYQDYITEIKQLLEDRDRLQVMQRNMRALRTQFEAVSPYEIDYKKEGEDLCKLCS